MAQLSQSGEKSVYLNKRRLKRGFEVSCFRRAVKNTWLSPLKLMRLFPDFPPSPVSFLLPVIDP